MAKITFDNRNNLFYLSLKTAVDQYFETKRIKKTGDWRLYIKTVTLIGAAIVIYISLMFFTMSALPALPASEQSGRRATEVDASKQHIAASTPTCRPRKRKSNRAG